jgi:hypothetical protein
MMCLLSSLINECGFKKFEGKNEKILFYFGRPRKGVNHMNTIRPAIEELERAFRELVPVFNREMPLPVITIQSKGRKNALGWFVRDKWSNTVGKLP